MLLSTTQSISFCVGIYLIDCDEALINFAAEFTFPFAKAGVMWVVIKLIVRQIF